MEIGHAGLREPPADAQFRVDLLWPGHRLVVELDGRGGHDSPSGFEEDRVRDNALALAGIRVLRFTRHRVRAHGQEVVRGIATALALSECDT